MISKPAGCRPCPLFSKGKGFCLGWGNPKTAMLALNLETPANNEISHLLDPADKMDNAEITRRMNAFPNLERKHVNKGIPIVGRSGWLVDQWILRAAGIRRHELFLDNTLRCFPPKGKNDSHYPIGEERKEAERICRQYDRWEEFKPEIAVISMHPASLLRDPSPLSLIVEDFKKMRDFAKQGFKVIGLLGGKSAKQFLKYGETVTRFRGHYQYLKGG